MDDLSRLKSELATSVSGASSLAALDEVRVAALGKKGVLTERLKGLSSLPVEERKDAGAALNVLKNEISELIEQRQSVLAKAERLESVGWKNY